ncbi:MAG TPA: PBP1A family penicillin-binding protein [Gaiellaceae bacterium]|nr:PBP1A family penicillin-binding protein [Gaiellaceae bacterium]
MSRRRDQEFLARHNMRKRKRTDRIRRRRRTGLVIAAIGVAAAVSLVVVGVGAGVALSAGCDLNALQPVNIGANSFVYADDGSLLGSIPAERNRVPVTMAKISPWLPKATVAIEDRRFYEHGGVDYIGIARAAWQDVTAGKVLQGGSTITQQLVRNLYTGQQRTFSRKLKEACLAIKLANKWSKQRILNDYLNTVYYGNHAYGIEAAAETYFSRHAKALTLPQAALLAGLPQAPSSYDPFVNPKDALARRDEVLNAMLKNGDIDQAQFAGAIAQRSLHLKPGSLYSSIREPYFFSYVIDQLEQQYGANTVREGGLKVYTTIDPRLQRLARKAMSETLPYSTDPAAALVSIQPGTGAIRAMTALVRRKGNQFNLAAQSLRQAGSTFKTFVLASAIERGIDPDNTYYTSAPFTCTVGPWCSPLDPWNVHTYENTYAGTESITRATLQSDNTIYAQLTLDVGPKYVWNMAHRLGVQMSPDKPVASIGLGSLSVSPLDMAAAYATFPAMGVYAKPRAITKVVLANGKVDKTWEKPQTHRVLSDGVAWEVTNVLNQNALYGTGAGSSDGIHPNAGKTGTTENHADAWFDGYTRELSTVVWMGYQAGEIPMLDVHGVSVQGATYAVPIWHQFMAAALWHRPAEPFPTPKHYPTYHYFQKGYYGSLGYVYTPTTTTSTTTTQAATTSAAPTTAAHTTPAPPKTTMHAAPPPPPPTTTEAPPPATTVEAPPPTTSGDGGQTPSP